MSWLALLIVAPALGSALLVLGAYCIQATWLGQRVRLRKEHLSCYAREVAVHWIYGLTAAFGLVQPPPRPFGPALDPEEGEVPVLLVPGYGVNRACMFWLAAWLRRRGWRWVWPVTPRPRGGGVFGYAVRLNEQVDRLRAVSGAERVDLVAHSMGGVVVACMLLQLGGAQRVRRVITLGTPWAGSRLGVFGRLAEARDMTPGSPLLGALGPLPVPVVSLFSRWDHMVVPVESAWVPWAEMVEIPRCGHLEMLYSARVARAVGHLLRRPEPARAPAPLEVPLIVSAAEAAEA